MQRIIIIRWLYTSFGLLGFNITQLGDVLWRDCRYFGRAWLWSWYPCLYIHTHSECCRFTSAARRYPVLPSDTLSSPGLHNVHADSLSRDDVYINIILLYVAFCTIMAISRQREARSRDYALLLFLMTSRVFYSAQYHRPQCTVHTFEQFGRLYMQNHNKKYPPHPGFEPGTSRLQAPVDANETSAPVPDENKRVFI